MKIFPQSLKLVSLSHPAIRQGTGEVKEITPEIETLVQKMFITMKENRGIGLAAPQVGIPLRLAVMEYEPKEQVSGSAGKRVSQEERVPKTILINPKVISVSNRQAEDEEGCLTTPDVYGPVKRAEEVVVETMDLTGKKIRIKAKGFFARVLQHELDHLKGIIFIDRVGDPGKLYTYHSPDGPKL